MTAPTINNARDEWMKSIGFEFKWHLWTRHDNEYAFTPDQATIMYQQMLEARLDELRGLPGKEPYVKSDGTITTVAGRRTELLAALSGKEEAE